MWGIALMGTPLGLLAVDVLTRRRMVDALRNMLFPPTDTQLLEARDVVWAWVMLIVGLGMALWGLKELIVPTSVVAADEDGIALEVRGPFRGPVRIPWAMVDDIGSASVEDEGEALPVLWVRLTDPSPIPDEPWSARWMDDQTIALLATDWDRDPTQVAGELTDVALAAARAQDEDPVG